MASNLETTQVDKNKQPYVMLWKYEKLYEEKYGRKPRMNKYRDKMAMRDVIDSVGFERGMDLLEYYFKTSKAGHSLVFFLYNFDRMDQAQRELVRDKKNREILREATKRMVEGEE